MAVAPDLIAAGDSSKNEYKSAKTIEIKPSGKWFDLSLSELFAYRELFYFLAWRDIKIRYKQTALGALWALLQPLLTVAIFSVVLGKLVAIKSDGIPYPLFVFCGLLPWTFISTTVASSSNSIVSGSNLITKVYFPRLIIPIASVGAGLVDFLLGLIFFIAMMIYYQVGLNAQMIFAPLFFLMMFALSVAVGVLLSALNVRFRDVKHIVPVALQLWMFASPVIYPSSLFPEKWRWLLALNPLTGILGGLRSSIFGTPFDTFAIVCSVAIIFVLLLIALIVFRHMEDYFADYI
jgi:lipopolysaccharide transport system permease protein